LTKRGEGANSILGVQGARFLPSMGKPMENDSFGSKKVLV